ncbi:MAG TPA: hypothetical protein VGG39_20065 [Polyangiaceae bacterium]|jgi:hypothetical protein
MRRTIATAALGALALSACAGAPPERVSPGPKTPMPAHGVLAEDTAPKEDLRMVPPEAYVRTYLALFGALAPVDVQKRARAADGSQLFDVWDDYVSALGFPDYRVDVPRLGQTNALMVATFERLGVALCDRAVEHDLKAHPPISERAIFAFDPPRGPVDAAAFAPRFDVLHRTFLGYPASLAPPHRAARYLQLFHDVAADHRKDDPRSRFTADEAAWAAVCYGLVRHPEFHLY